MAEKCSKFFFKNSLSACYRLVIGEAKLKIMSHYYKGKIMITEEIYFAVACVYLK